MICVLTNTLEATKALFGAFYTFDVCYPKQFTFFSFSSTIYERIYDLLMSGLVLTFIYFGVSVYLVASHGIN